MNKVIKTIEKIIVNLIIVVLAIIAILVILGFCQVNIQKKQYINIFGYSVLSAETGSMSPTIEKGDIVIGMMHYPPFNTKWEDSPFTEIFNLNNINTMVYGHIHGKNSSYKKVIKKGELSCHICSCDLLDNMPVLIGEV